MKGKISLKDFIKEVKKDLISAIDKDDPFFIMKEVELEVTFALNVSGKAGAKFFVVDAGVETGATQTHKAKIRLTPFVTEKNTTISAQTNKRRPMCRRD